MKIKLKNLYRKSTFLTFWPVFIVLAGCISDNTSVKRPISSIQAVSQTSNLDLITYYRNEKYPMVIKSAQMLLKSDPENWEAKFFMGLAYFNYGDNEGAFTTFKLIPENVRSNMVDSCLELQGLNSTSNEKQLSKLASKFFPDCLNDLTKPTKISNEIEIDDNAVKNYGQLYDASISTEDDPKVRKLKEQEFLKKHKLSEEQLSEITARYLELIAEE